MNKIIVFGAAGRMGRTIVEMTMAAPDLELAGAVDRALDSLANLTCPVATSLEELAERGVRGAVIDFGAPDASVENAEACAKNAMPLVIGTTGFTDAQMEKLRYFAKKTPILWSANMSVGVNALLKILPELAKILGPAYDMEIVETHHRHKKDAPSGTALTLARALASARGWNLADCARYGREGQSGERPEKEIGVHAVRGGEVAGVHDCYFFGSGEEITVSHRAESRENFAGGALRAARWLFGRPAGVLYSMMNVLDDSKN